MFFLPPGSIDYAKHVFQGPQEGYAGGKNQHNIHLVYWCLPGHDLTTLGHESSALTTRPLLFKIKFSEETRDLVVRVGDSRPRGRGYEKCDKTLEMAFQSKDLPDENNL